MMPILSLLNGFPYLEFPQSFVGWLGWLLLLGIVIFTVIRLRRLQPRASERLWLVVCLVILAVPSNLFLGVRLSAGTALPTPGLPLIPQAPGMFFFSALAWMLAGGFLGPISTLLIGLLTGLLRGLWGTHNLFTLLEPALLAMLFSLAIRQRYRTAAYRLLRQPFWAGLALLPVAGLVFVGGAFCSISGSLAARLDYALTNLLPSLLALGGELLVGAVFAQVLALAFPGSWGSREPLQPSPAEKSLHTRFLLGSGAVIILLLLTLLVGNWIVAVDAARGMLRERLTTIAKTNSEIVPFFLETGQSLALNLAADPNLASGEGSALDILLGEKIRISPFFDQLILLDGAGNRLGAYPPTDLASLRLTSEEIRALPLALSGVISQVYTVAPGLDEPAARVAFIAAVPGSSGIPERVLVARTSLVNNPLTKPLITSLRGMAEMGGMGILLDAQGRILFHPVTSQVMADYAGQRSEQPAFYDLPAPGGTRDYVYYQPVSGVGWGIVLDTPAQQAQQYALQIAAPLSIVIFLLGVVALIGLRLGLRGVTASLQSLAVEAGRISQGQLDHPLPAGGVDEVGQLRTAFEDMRISLSSRLNELNQLLLVSQGVASSLDIQDAIQPILQAVLVHGASAVRVVLIPSPTQAGDELPASFSAGPLKEVYAYLDAQIIELVRRQENPVILLELIHARGLDIPAGHQQPATLMAVPIRHENRFFGALWAAYDQVRSLKEEDGRFLSTLAGQAALAATNARLFRSAELGRQRLAAILASTPDPVLVTNHENRILLTNPAARQAMGVAAGAAEGQPAGQVITQKELVELLQISEPEKQSAEVVMPDGKIYFATASSIMANNRPVGRVCVLRDVTHFKELDALKTDFVSTVSHDLRSPLTLMRGYATMLELRAGSDEHLKEYASKIIVGVESMSHLVNNLLDLGRIDAGVGLQLAPVDLSEMVTAVVNTLQLQATEKNIALAIEMAPDLPASIEADRVLLQQAVYNLVENAIKYTPDNGRVALMIKTRSEVLLVEVQDDGIGISQSDQPRLFEKFFRGTSREARQQRGSGLGLAIVRSIAEQHGGRVWVESQVGKGSTFFLLVPQQQGHKTK
jgi:PAS domain S-box-containing protein